MDAASTSVYRWAAWAVALVVFKFTVEKAFLIRTAFARIKCVYTSLFLSLCQATANFYIGITQAMYRYGSTRSAQWLLR